MYVLFEFKEMTLINRVEVRKLRVFNCCYLFTNFLLRLKKPKPLKIAVKDPIAAAIPMSPNIMVDKINPITPKIKSKIAINFI